VFAMVLGAALLHAIWNTILKVNGDRLVVMAVITLSQSVIALCVLPFVDFPTAAAWPYIGLSLVLHIGYYVFLVMAYRYGDLSLVYPIARGSAPLIIAAASVVFAGEVLGHQATLAITLIAVGIMSLAFTRKTSGFGEPKAIILAFGTGVFIAAYTITDGMGARTTSDAHSYFFWLIAVDGLPITLLALLVHKGRAIGQARKIWKVALFAGVVSLIAYWTVVWAMTMAPIALVSAVRETSMLFAVLFGVIYLHEPLDIRRIVACMVTLAGAILIKTAK
jgi:drug/metabolite transporter (DMT)-like permease